MWERSLKFQGFDSLKKCLNHTASGGFWELDPTRVPEVSLLIPCLLDDPCMVWQWSWWELSNNSGWVILSATKGPNQMQTCYINIIKETFKWGPSKNLQGAKGTHSLVQNKENSSDLENNCWVFNGKRTSPDYCLAQTLINHGWKMSENSLNI